MPEMRGSKMCPVMSFTTYISTLSLECNYLWQSSKYGKINYEHKVWHGRGCVSQNTLDSFITNIFTKLGMKDKGYTNHSLRVSEITNLTQEKFANKQIMSISGHKNQESLAIYQKVNSNEKLRMGLTLGYSLLNMPRHQGILQPAQIQNQIYLQLNTHHHQRRLNCCMNPKTQFCQMITLLLCLPTPPQDPTST